MSGKGRRTFALYTEHNEPRTANNKSVIPNTLNLRRAPGNMFVTFPLCLSIPPLPRCLQLSPSDGGGAQPLYRPRIIYSNAILKSGCLIQPSCRTALTPALLSSTRRGDSSCASYATTSTGPIFCCVLLTRTASCNGCVMISHFSSEEDSITLWQEHPQPCSQ